MGIKYLDKDGLEYFYDKLQTQFAQASDIHPVDSTISSTSVNPVENRAIYAAIAAAVQSTELHRPEVYFNTTAGWAAQGSLVSEANTLYIYTDYQQDSEGNDIPGIKIGDGNAYLIDKPFLDTIYYEHVNDTDIHITAEEREFWNNKVRCYYSPTNDETVIFTTQ
jgi:hypothetical protein